MCGIIAYIGNKPADSVLIVALKKLEYRGYDSAGIATLDKNELFMQKTIGRVEKLEVSLRSQESLGKIGIAHTRWATHGEPSVINAHPHHNTIENIAVVHNGIIENFLELKKFLFKKGYVFISETDTEVIVHLIDWYYKKSNNLENAFYQSLLMLEGKYAIAMISEIEPDRFFFSTRECPLIIAKGKHDDFLCASDIPALIPLAQEFYYLETGDWGYVTKNTLVVKNAEGKLVEIKMEQFSFTEDEMGMCGYPHYMLKEIHEQPDIIENILQGRIKNTTDIHFDNIFFPDEYFKDLGKIKIQACGTSLHAGMVGKIYFEHFAKVYTDAEFSSELIYRNPVLEGNTLVIPISQSGETADTLAGLYNAHAKFLRSLSIVNNIYSTMARKSDFYISIDAGQEVGVASTKAYTAQLCTLLLLSLHIAKIKGVKIESLDEIFKELRQVPEKMRSILLNVESIQEIAKYLSQHNSAIFLGRTFNYPTALEASLKLKEISYIHSSAYAAGEFKHGPIALIQDGFPVVFVAQDGEVRKKMISSLLEVKSRKGKIITIISKGDNEIKNLSDFVIEIPKCSEFISPMLTILPLQLMAYYTALYKDCDVDRPRNLAKSVTVE